jgi:AcrR family transcriptional regulator
VAVASASTKERLIRAGEQVFARDGIDGARIRDINELAGQRNSSALHYHFGSRSGLASAILYGHQADIDQVVEVRLDALEAAERNPSVRDIVTAIVTPMVAKLHTDSGRDWARIVPQMMPVVSANLRRGLLRPTTPQSDRVVGLLSRGLAGFDETVRRERLVDYSLILTTLLAERAHVLASGIAPLLDDEQLVMHLVDVLVAVLTAPSTVPTGGSVVIASRTRS